MSSRVQLDMRNLSLGRRHLVNTYEVEAGIGVIPGNTVWSMPERLECEVLQKARYINTLTFTFTFTWLTDVYCSLQRWRLPCGTWLPTCLSKYTATVASLQNLSAHRRHYHLSLCHQRLLIWLSSNLANFSGTMYGMTGDNISMMMMMMMMLTIIL